MNLGKCVLDSTIYQPTDFIDKYIQVIQESRRNGMVYLKVADQDWRWKDVVTTHRSTGTRTPITEDVRAPRAIPFHDGQATVPLAERPRQKLLVQTLINETVASSSAIVAAAASSSAIVAAPLPPPSALSWLPSPRPSPP